MKNWFLKRLLTSFIISVVWLVSFLPMVFLIGLMAVSNNPSPNNHSTLGTIIGIPFVLPMLLMFDQRGRNFQPFGAVLWLALIYLIVTIFVDLVPFVIRRIKK